MTFDNDAVDTADNGIVTLKSYRPAYDRKMSMPPMKRSAVEVRRVKLSYGRGSKARSILSGIDLNVPEGAM